MSNQIKKVTIIGAGFTGRQIAARTALYDYNVCLYDIKEEVLEDVQEFLKKFFRPKSKRDKRKNVYLENNISKAMEDVDLVIEAIPEDVELKQKIFSEIDKLAPEHTIIGTNSSSYPVSKIESAVKRKDKVLNIHFYPPIPLRPMVDIMKGTQTSDKTFEKGKKWIQSIECTPLVVKKEIMGFVFNRIWRAVKREAIHMWANGNADVETIDTAWKIFTGMNMGPFELMDGIGLDVAYNVEMSYYKESKDPKDKPPDKFTEKIEKGELGLKTGKGFYKWKSF
ncbi:MAG: 3-hydroxyacyl-CoA dehydrogenase family protein [Candidatus Lokiarchaeota archaeon]|nr:3-hydroxyacyl-CoA dehydrogenase family protein [Candidatus Lokiarchaeota archaeon]MBD3199699.1 3-hydroxyacyl-CoA dehydrogenase family protein [Candidatus Lokiarchaeota archaeon]